MCRFAHKAAPCWRVYLDRFAQEDSDLPKNLLAEERKRQLAEIARRRKLFRRVRPQAPMMDRSVIVTDDGIATGATMIAALQVVKAQRPSEVIVAVPVASPDRLAEVRRWCDDVVCLLTPESFWAIDQFYEDFTQVEDKQVVALLREFAPAPQATEATA
jgi:predicted phosphoribosyltransferase